MESRFKLFFTFLLYFLIQPLMAQQDFVIAGGTFYRPTGNISLSVGQVFYQQNASQAGSESQGVQQAYDVSEIYANNFNYHFSVYPNPVQNNLILESDDYEAMNFEYFLVDTWGQILINDTVNSHLTNLDLQRLSRATYYLIIKTNQTKIKVFKIIKK